MKDHQGFPKGKKEGHLEIKILNKIFVSEGERFEILLMVF
jgi:hypothetical protein